MNPGTFQGAGTGALGGSITRYTQTPTITTSQTIPVPNGVQRIEALLVGGGGAGYGGATGDGHMGSGGGFGGLYVLEIPVTGSPLQVVIGAGGVASSLRSTVGTAGSPTYVVSAGTRYAEVGGGGAGAVNDFTANSAGMGRSGGGGGGASAQFVGQDGGGPPIGRILFCAYPQQAPYHYREQTGAGTTNSYYTSGRGGYLGSTGFGGINGGGGGGGGSVASTQTYAGGNGGPGGGGAGGSFNSNSFAGAGGMGGGGGAVGGTTSGGTGSGGSLASVSIWGYTGFAGGTQSTGAQQGGGGGGGLLSAGAANSGAAGGNGGNGGGGGGGAYNATSGNLPGNGGNGCAVIRFYF